MRRVTATVETGTAQLEPDPDRPGAATLWVGGVPHSYVDLADPTHLSFEYVRQIGDVIDVAFEPGRRIAALHLGGGGLTLARYVAATRPGSTQRAVELDGGLVALVRAELPVAPSDRIKITTADARAALARQRPGLLDLVVVDVFADGQVPSDLVTVEAASEIAAVLAPGGVVVINIVDGKPLRFAREAAATIGARLAHVALLAEPSIWRGRRFGNLVLVASAHPLPLDALRRRLSGGTWPARLVAGSELADLVAGAVPRTDAAGGSTPRPPANVFAPLRPPAADGNG